MKKSFTYLAYAVVFFATIIVLLKIYSYSFITQATAATGITFFKQPDTTEVFVLGTLHKTTHKIDYDDLYNLLEKIKPNIILLEKDSLSFDKEMNWKPNWWRVKFPNFLNKYRQSNLEQIAVQKYLHHNTNTIIRPYEWSLRDKFHKENQILTTPDRIFEKLNVLYSNGQLTDHQKTILDDYYSLTNQLEKFGDSTLYEINTNFQDGIARNRQNSVYHNIKTIIDSNDNFIEFREFYTVNEAYWDLRNLAMVDNIEKYIKLYPKSRIVVLNGYYHRYYLRDELAKKQTDLNFNLKDIGR